ncbi:MAG: amidase [Arenicellales bacterium]|jgi:amidase|nr:amidase [Arenicellales bacterium]MDP7618259.1 amidase [Arenicellales bacterium]HJP44998.1 amidase [Arenicellales bacterium]|tara:strand:+ start:2258 stop:3697 length:1440 start_codon:yes stop_codon:yes gene_type:complete
MTSTDLELCYLSAADVLERFRACSLSPVEYLAELIKRAEETEPVINAFAFTWFDQAMDQAKEAEAKYARKHADIRELEGLPVAVKDQPDIKGQPMTMGSLYLKDNVSAETDFSIQRLLDAGVIVHGRTTTGEFCCSGVSDSKIHGTTHTPWKNGYTCGGSSGGSGAALAVGSTPLATGSDIGGSIRIPAACCGVVGYKPPYGRNPGCSAVHFDTYAVMGPMTRTVSDAVIMQNLLCGPHPLDNASIRPKYVLPNSYEDIQGLKIAWSMDLGFFEVDEHVHANTMKTLDVLKDLGAELVEVDFGWSAGADRDLLNYLDHLFNGYIKSIVDTDPDLATPWATYCANAAGKTSAADFSAAYETQAKMSRHVGAIMDGCYAFICPTCNFQEIPADQDPNDPVVINGKTVDPLYGWCMAHPFNMLGRLPVLSVPSGIGGNGLPTGIQIVARHLDDERVFRVATALEKAQPWLDCPERRPCLLRA